MCHSPFVIMHWPEETSLCVLDYAQRLASWSLEQACILSGHNNSNNKQRPQRPKMKLNRNLTKKRPRATRRAIGGYAHSAQPAAERQWDIGLTLLASPHAVYLHAPCHFMILGNGIWLDLAVE